MILIISELILIFICFINIQRNGEHTIVILTLNVYKLSVEITKVINHPLGFMTLIQETLLLSTKMNQDLSATLILIVMPHKYFAEIYTMTPL